ncbi:MAG: ABC-F family ATP-binding cassette domain-containing protein, partial [Catenulispora sp.]|nr:ABC-F family ATP-binding cassette domain-containing protein [Catenulispora sp.]
NRTIAALNVARLDTIPRKMPFSVFGHGGFRMRGRGHGAMGRIRNAKTRVERLNASPVTPPAEPLRLAAEIRTAGTGTPDDSYKGAAELFDIRVTGRLDIPHLRVEAGERLLVTGPNGAGKSTLLQVLAGELRPDHGSVRVPDRVGHLRQQGTPWPPSQTVVQAFAAGRPGGLDEHADLLLALGLFRPADLGLRIGDLSYGQRRRVEVARLVTEQVDLILLDEPTNHLAPALVEELEAALADYTGAVVVVTHDRRMRERFDGRHVEVRAGRVAEAATA